MVSYKNFLSISVIMIILLFMFQFLQVFVEHENEYNINEQVEYSDVPENIILDGPTEREKIVYVGDKESAIAKVVSQWCTYTKREYISSARIPEETELKKLTEKVPELFLLDAGYVDFEKETSLIEDITLQGIPVVFCNLPDISVIEENEKLRELLGISEIISENTAVEGLQVYSGFFLGGELILKAEKEEDLEKQDLKLNMPWFSMDAGTKVYMVGMLDEEQAPREEFPACLWRNHVENSFVFAVNGDYMSTLTGIGILDAFVHELRDYTLYPVVNAESVIVTNYPSFARENEERIFELYSRDTKSFERDIVWPGIVALAEKRNLKLTFMLTPQFDYLDEIEPDEADYVFYLQQMKEIDGEAGMSLANWKQVPITEKISRDKAFFDLIENQYKYASCYMEDASSEELEQVVGQNPALQGIRTIAYQQGTKYPLLAFYNEGVTLQGITGDAKQYTFSQELQYRSLETALGYSNFMLDAERVLWPELKEDQWENYSDEVFSNISIYWKQNRKFDNTTLLESDKRLRSFLNLQYSQIRDGNTIYMKLKNHGEQSWFLLRTHGESVVAVKGADYQMLEDDIYLLQIYSENVEIQLE